MVINDAGNSIEALRRADVARADFFIAVTDSDEVNLIACAVVEGESSNPLTIARVRNIDYATLRSTEKAFLGIDYIVNPETEAANSIIRTIDRGAVSDIMLFKRTTVQMRNITVDRDSPFRDHPLSEISKKVVANFLVAVVVRDNDFIIPSGNTVIRQGDVLYIAATEEDFEKLFARIGKHRRTLRRIVLVGGGKIGTQVADHLMTGQRRGASLLRRLLDTAPKANGKREIKIVERDYSKCKALSQRFPDALVINADISDEGVFEEEHLMNADLIIAATENQELNMISAIYAKTFGIQRTVVLVSKANYVNIAANLGIDVAVSLKNAVVSGVLKFIRRGNIQSVHSISDGKVEVLEITVEAASRAEGERIDSLRLPPSTLIVSVDRAGEHMVPTGNYVFEAGDNAIVIAKKDSINRVQETFTTSS
jgi:trk system potassium uptake protein TrkA